MNFLYISPSLRNEGKNMKKNLMASSLSEKVPSDEIAYEKAIAHEILKGEKNLIKGKKRISGRNNQGRITVRRRGGGHKRNYRFVSFSLGSTGGTYSKTDLVFMVYDLVYDPNRSAPLALIGPVVSEGFSPSLGSSSTIINKTQYIIAPKGIVPGDIIKIWGFSVAKATKGSYGKMSHWRPSLGDSLPLWQMPLGSIIHNIEEQPGKGGQYIRAGGGYGQILDKVSFEESKGNLMFAEGNSLGSPLSGISSSRKKMTSRGHPFLGGKVLVRLPSGEKKWFPSNGRASFGAVSLRNITESFSLNGGPMSREEQTQVASLPHKWGDPQVPSNIEANSVLQDRILSFGRISPYKQGDPKVPTAKKKAGRSRWLGRRPKVRGIAMNPVDHPHGGRTSGGRPSVTPWGRPTKGWKTRSPSKTSFQYKGRI